MAVLVAIEAVVLVLLAVLVAGLLRSHAEILRRLHDLGAGVDQPAERGGRVRRDQFNVFPEVPSPPDRTGEHAGRDIVGVGLDDDAISVRVVGAAHSTLVAFLSSGCLTCARFWEAFADPALRLPPETRLVIVTKDPAEESLGSIRAQAPAGVPLVLSSEAWASYDVPGSPYFVWVDGATGRVRGEGTGLDWDQVAGLLGQAVDDAASRPGGTPRRGKADADAAREARIDRELAASGILPGDASLYDQPEAELTDERAPGRA